MIKVNSFAVSILNKKINVLVYDPSKQEIETKKEINEIHHIHILDRSGSMHSSINELIDNVQESFNVIGDNDYLSIIWFSSPKEYRTLIKGARKSDDIKTLLDSIRSTLNTTCFSDPLKETLNVIEELKPLCPNFSITLFTDGQPVVPWGNSEEEKRSTEIVKKISSYAMAFNTIGYGNYYNQNFLKELSAFSQFGVFTHSSEIGKYFEIFDNNYKTIAEMVDKRTIIKSDKEIMYIGPKTIILNNNELNQRQRSKTKNIYYIITDDINQVLINDEPIVVDTTINNKEEVKTITNDFMYSYAYILYYNSLRKNALDVLLSIGDKNLIDKQIKAFSFDEVAEYTKLLKEAALNEVYRFNDGKVKSDYLPKGDAFCFMDLFSLLSNNDSLYIPFSNRVEKYKAISRKTTDTFDLFVPDYSKVYAPVENFVYNSERLNLSIRFEIPGKVKINPIEAKQLNLPEMFDSKIYRNNTFINDGSLNIRFAEFYVTDKCLSLLSKKDIITYQSETISKIDDKEYRAVVIDFSKLPIINTKYISNATIENIYNDVLKENKLEARIKYLNKYLNEVYEKESLKKEGEFKKYTVDQIACLERHGIRKDMSYGGVNEKRNKVTENSDFYEARVLSFYLKGVSSLPSIAEVEKKLTSDKSPKLTTAFSLMQESFIFINDKSINEGVDIKSKVVKTRNWLKEQLYLAKKELFGIRTNLASMKLAKVLTRDWFTGLTIDGNNTIYTPSDKSNPVMVVKTAYEKIYLN